MNEIVLSYSGDVSIDLTIQGKTFNIQAHNAGTHYLMKCFAKMLTGNHKTDGTEEPKFLELQCLDMNNFPDGYQVQDSDWKSYLKAIIPLQRPQYLPQEDNSYESPYASFMAVITADNLLQTVEFDAKKLYRFLLTTAYDEATGLHNQLASLMVDQTTLMKITPGTEATVNWIMRVQNQT